ncbi:hypothetical protein M407DRAFT_20006 [Tulasnella calospora MUT 4182]|uniref:Uncharacterized protein n=1 Tax=Tulasnella calospora MUT 4182 TaxID=1051891 RepID=A0A0C3QGS5_9AGAM|nr:hypothetical protein M407DRAFT_20006 [Tulasnella calospora MUT 4182]
MSNALPKPLEVKAYEKDADAQRQGERLEQQLGAIDLNSPLPDTESPIAEEEKAFCKRSPRNTF